VFEDLNEAQRLAVEHRGSPLLIVAGAGTGKTRTLVARVASLVQNGADPQRILLLTFTRRAAAEMLGRVAAATSTRAAAQVCGGTFHATANRLLRQSGRLAGLPDGFTVLDQGDSVELFNLVRSEEGLGERGRRFPRAETIAGIYSRMVNSQARLTEVLERDFPWCAEHADALKALYSSYTARKRRHQVLDFDDLLLFWRALTAAPTGGDALRSLFDHVLVDEYQDTNALQSDIVRGMAGPGTEVTVVGDDAQAIYGFRAATVANLWDFPRHFPGAATITLEQNYRSTSPILAVANGVLAQSANHLRKELWTNRPDGARPRLVTCADEGAQSRLVAEAVLDARERGIELRQQAVLFRAASHSDALELELTRRDIPFVKYGGLTYLEAAHVKDLLALLRVVENPADTLAWHRVLRLLDGVGPATVRRLTAELGLDGPDDEAGPHPALGRLLAGEVTVPSAAAMQTAELAAALSDCVAGLVPSEQVERLMPFCALVFPRQYPNPAARLADLDQLAAAARGHTDRSRFLAELTLDPPGRTGEWAGRPHLDDDWLTLSTIHSAKGREWRTVHLIHAADGNIPSDMALSDRDGLAEELRLLYVAVTRAREELTITFPLRYHVNRLGLDDRHHLAQLSRFLEPVRDHLDQVAPSPQDELEHELAGVRVDLADEVDLALHGLWD
jgi:DNA helicase-2/ATP-dependent DNA helicase PcrA